MYLWISDIIWKVSKIIVSKNEKWRKGAETELDSFVWSITCLYSKIKFVIIILYDYERIDYFSFQKERQL